MTLSGRVSVPDHSAGLPMAWPPARARPARCSPATLIVHRLAVSAAAQYAGIDQAGSADQDALLRVHSAVAKRVQVNMNCLCREVRFASYGLPAGVGRGVSQCVRRVLAAQSPGPAVANRWARWSTSSTCSSPWLASGGVSGWLWPMTMSTPSGTHQRCDSVREAVAATWKPAWRPSWMAIEPTPPAAPITSRFLPAARPQSGWKGMRQNYSSQAVGGPAAGRWIGPAPVWRAHWLQCDCHPLLLRVAAGAGDVTGVTPGRRPQNRVPADRRPERCRRHPTPARARHRPGWGRSSRSKSAGLIDTASTTAQWPCPAVMPGAALCCAASAQYRPVDAGRSPRSVS